MRYLDPTRASRLADLRDPMMVPPSYRRSELTDAQERELEAIQELQGEFDCENPPRWALWRAAA